MAPMICQKRLTYKRLSVKKLQILCGSDHPIWFKFCQFVVNVVINLIKELQIVFGTSNISKNNRNMEEPELI